MFERFRRMREGARKVNFEIDQMNNAIDGMVFVEEGDEPVADPSVYVVPAQTEPTYQDLCDLVADMTKLIGDQSEIIDKATAVLDVFHMVGAKGKPMFRIDKGHDDNVVVLLTHVVLDLHAAIHGSNAPAFAMEHRILH